MKREDLELPLFTVSPKTYFTGEDAVAAARTTDMVAAGRRHTIFYSAPMPELFQIAQSVCNVVVTAQHADLIGDGKGMGLAPLESLKSIGVEAIFLNHTAHPLCVNRLAATIDQAKELGFSPLLPRIASQSRRQLPLWTPMSFFASPALWLAPG